MNKSKSMNIFAVNAAGIKSKLKSFNKILLELCPEIWMLQETKLKPHEHIKCASLSDYQIFYLNRQESQGGGLAVGVTKDLESTLIREGDDETEAMAVKVVVGNLAVRIINAYGAQENASKAKKEKFWNFIEEEVNKTELEEEGLILQMDGNLHAGPTLLPDDPNPQNKNGKIFMDFLERNPSLIVVNSLEICEGMITRKRVVQTKTEEAVLDFFIVNEKMRPFLGKMMIDEGRKYSLSNFAQYKKNKRVIETDHYSEILQLDLHFEKRKPNREEMFNLKNKACQEAFKEETDVNPHLLEVLDTDLPFEIQCKKWFKTFNSILYKCFKKVRIVNNKKKEVKINEEECLLKERVNLQKEMKEAVKNKYSTEEIEERLKEVERNIASEIEEDNIKEIVESLKALGGEEHSLGGSGRKHMWKILKQKYPKILPVIPVGKKDRHGNLITNHEGLKHLYLETYIKRLRNRPIRSDFEELKKMKMELFNLRLKLAENKKSVPWEMKHLIKVLNDLKKDKARDPNGWLNDIFKDGVAGKNLKISMLNLFNKMKAENHIPDFIRLADVATIYKGKGEKCDLVNDRGIFLVTTFRSILMRMIYQDKYEGIDQSMSDSQIGGRKGKNIRNHIWMINGIICDVLSSKKKTPVDIQIFDYKQCFDSLWLEECLNDVFPTGLNDDKFALLYNVNSHVNIAVKTPVGKTERGTIRNVITQGDVFGPILCSKQVDTIGQECLVENKYTYMYKGEVEIPPLGMVDDLLCVSECGFKTAMLNSYINFKTNSKKLQFGVTKCKKIHIGKVCEDFKCQALSIDKWIEVETENDIEDKFVGDEIMEDSEDEKYLGDIISNDGRNIKNIKARVNKGTGIVTRIMNMLNGIPFGKYYFEVAVILRDSLLVSSVLCNSEAWYNVTNAELDLLETVDLMFMRKLFNTPKTTPKEMYYLELGVLPFRDVMRKKRLSFLQYILNENQDSMIYRFLQSQLKSSNPKDWIQTVSEDIKELKMNVTTADIKEIRKSTFKAMLRECTENYVFKSLTKKKLSHSKVMHIDHYMLKMRKYLMPSSIKITKDERKLIFRLRSRTTETKTNFKGKYDYFECDVCGKEEESQEHILKCTEIMNMNKEKQEQEIPNYKRLFDGQVSEQLHIARCFQTNLNIRDNMLKNK